MKRTTLLAAAFLLTPCLSVRAEDIVNTLAGYNTSGAWGPTGPTASWVGHPTPYGDSDAACRFTNGGTPHAVTMIQLPLDTFYFCPGNIADISIFTDKIRPDEAHIPDRELEHVRIYTLVKDVPAICTADFSGGTILDPNTYYWVMVSAPGSEMVKWFFQNASFGYGYSSAYRTNLGMWDLYGTGSEGAMRVVGEPVADCNCVEFLDVASFAARWLETSCIPTNRWCGGTDLDQSGTVNEMDLALLTDYWLVECPANWPLR
jgi:hypothetical protein